mmetsp:Transcript_6260/g.17635  ORF Transcript_6260/g.17635 Transcript_6260/m.17635 type:complete len:231 (+) Transcript_6260:1535-2227(+)
MTLWQGSQNLCHYLLHVASTTTASCDEKQHSLNSNSNFSLENKTVCELGAGLGLCGIVAHLYGKAREVLLTDGDTDTLANMRRNIALNVPPSSSAKSGNDNDIDPSRTIRCKQLLWGKNVDAFREKYTLNNRGFDIVMGGDVAYAQEALGILFETAMVLLSKDDDGAVFLLSFVFRGGVKLEHVLECADQHHLRWEKVWPQSSTEESVVEETDDSGEGIYVFQRISPTQS